MDVDNVQDNYGQNAASYDLFATTPLGTLEKQLFELCITDCEGLHVLDLGGGSGHRAREALAAGAHSVDVVDLSPDMMREGQAHERSIGRDRITWHHADASASLDHLSLGPYDLVIANGVLDHAQDGAALEKMWHNAAAYLKPGGRLIVNRNFPFSAAAAPGAGAKYGVQFTDFEDVPGGVRFAYRVQTDPPLVFFPTMLRAYYDADMELAKRFFDDFQIVPFRETAVVKADPEMWSDYLTDPILYVYTARKPA